MRAITRIMTGALLLWGMAGCDGFLDEYSVSEVRPTELTDL